MADESSKSFDVKQLEEIPNKIRRKISLRIRKEASVLHVSRKQRESSEPWRTWTKKVQNHGGEKPTKSELQGDKSHDLFFINAKQISIVNGERGKIALSLG